MTRERFEELAEAYGGDLARWPAELRDDAALLAAGDAAFARAVLRRAGALDALLADAPAAQPSSALVGRILASAPSARERRRWRLWLAPAGLGAGLAAVAAAGLLLGAELGQRSTASTDNTAQAVADLDVSTVSEVG